MTDAIDESEEVEDAKDVCILPFPDFTEMSDSFLLTDRGKTNLIRNLEREVKSLTRQLTEARNLINTLYSEIDRYKRVNSQVGWLIEQFRYTISGSDIRKSRLPLSPPPLSPPPSLAIMGAENEGSQVTEHSYLTESVAEEADAEDEYSEEWETSEETEDQTPSTNILYDGETPGPQDTNDSMIGPQIPRDLFIGPQDLSEATNEFQTPYSLTRTQRDPTPLPRAPRDPTPIPIPLFSDPESQLDALLATVTPQTRISEIFRHWCPTIRRPPS